MTKEHKTHHKAWHLEPSKDTRNHLKIQLPPFTDEETGTQRGRGTEPRSRSHSGSIGTKLCLGRGRPGALKWVALPVPSTPPPRSLLTYPREQPRGLFMSVLARPLKHLLVSLCALTPTSPLCSSISFKTQLKGYFPE